MAEPLRPLDEGALEALERLAGLADRTRWEEHGSASLAAEVRRLRAWCDWVWEESANPYACDWALQALAGRPAPQTVERHPWWLVG
jgi:hypothetical protein